jgi:signal transduction histidine kinase
MGWLRDRLARLGVRSPAGRDAVAAAALAVLGLARAVVTLVVSGGRLPVPGWQLAAANLASTADFGTIALRRRAPRTALALATAVVVAAAALPVRYAVQVGAADRLVDRDATAAKATLASIRRQGRETLTALRQLVGVVRDSDEAGPRAPQPTLARLDELVAGAREGGMTVKTTWSSHGRPLPPTVDLAAYRIVQESLTNARRHAPGAAVSVAVAVDDSGARVVVANGPPGKGSGSASGRRVADSDRQDRRSGHGLAGMRERVQLTGGTLTAGPTGQGGWRVEARLPAPPPQDGRA